MTSLSTWVNNIETAISFLDASTLAIFREYTAICCSDKALHGICLLRECRKCVVCVHNQLLQVDS